MEPVFRTLEIAAKALVAATGTKITYQHLEHIPRTGGAVVAINHTSYVDWLPAALALHRRGRRVRYMIKAEMQQVKVVDFLIRHTKTVPVNRGAGAQAYAEAVRLLRAGEVVGLMPEATISRSFELKDFKTGAARMALEADVPDGPADRVGRPADLDQRPPATAGPGKGPGHRGRGSAVAADRRRRASRRRTSRRNDVVTAPRAGAVSAPRGGVLGPAAAGRQCTYGGGGKDY